MTSLLGVISQMTRRKRPVETKVYIRRLNENTVFVNNVNRLGKQLDHVKYIVDLNMAVYSYAKDGSIRLVGSVGSHQARCKALRKQIKVSGTRLRKAWLGYQNVASRDTSFR